MAKPESSEHETLVRLVYDGPPEAGKTTSLVALSRCLRRDIYTPSETLGRTDYFDWVEYSGGRFDGASIRCQVISVPGQPRWAARRDSILEAADAIVFVGDTRQDGWPGTINRLTELRTWLDSRPGPPVGIVFQANKRDLPDILSLERVREDLQRVDPRLAIVESIARDETGIREVFVFGVRLALERLREFNRTGEPRPEVPFDSEAALLVQLKKREGVMSTEASGSTFQDLDESSDDLASTIPTFEEADSPEPSLDLGPAPAAPARPDSKSNEPVPTPPSGDVPSGHVWPPVRGRMIIQQASKQVRLRHLANGDWMGVSAGGWRIHSRAGAEYKELEHGRAALIAWARAHTSARPVASERRCVALAPTGIGGWRLWQFVVAQNSLHAFLIDSIRRGPAGAIAKHLADAARRLLAAQQTFTATGAQLPCTAETVRYEEPPMFVGLMPWIDDTPPASCSPESVARELGRLVRARAHPDRLEAISNAVMSLSSRHLAFDGASTVSRHIVEELSSMIVR